MFERFSRRARRVMDCARRTAVRLRSDALDSGHLLLGICLEGREPADADAGPLVVKVEAHAASALPPGRDGSGSAARAALRRLGVDVETLARTLEDALPRDVVPPRTDPTQRPRSLPFTPQAKSTLERTVAAGARIGDAWLGTEHLLLALAEEQDGVAGEALRRVGATPERVREAIVAG